MKAEKFSYAACSQNDALRLAQAKCQEVVNSDANLDDGLYLVHAPREQSYYVEYEAPMIRPGLGEEIIWNL